jgi:hypothetical protein
MKGKGAGLLLALGKPGAEEEDDDGGDDLGGAKQRAAGDVLSALKGGDAGALSAALERHYAACGMGSDDGEEY